MELVGSEFMDRLDYYHRAWLPARALVEDAIRRRFEVLPMLVLGGLKGGWSPGAGGGQVPLVLTSPHSSGHGSAYKDLHLFAVFPLTLSLQFMASRDGVGRAGGAQ